MRVRVQGILVGLLAAFSYELSILHAALRLTSADAFRTLHALYRERTHPLSDTTTAKAAPGSTGKPLPQHALLLNRSLCDSPQHCVHFSASSSV